MMQQLKLLSNFNNHSRELQQTHDSIKKSQESKKNDDTSSASAGGPAPIIIRKELFGPASVEPKKQPSQAEAPPLMPQIIDQSKFTTDKKKQNPSKLLYANLEEYSAAKEYERKIKIYKKGNYKYKKKDDEKSVDDKTKTK